MHLSNSLAKRNVKIQAIAVGFLGIRIRMELTLVAYQASGHVKWSVRTDYRLACRSEVCAPTHLKEQLAVRLRLDAGIVFFSLDGLCDR